MSWCIMYSKLDSNARTNALVLEHHMIPVLAKMMFFGIGINKKACHRTMDKLFKKLKTLEAEARQVLGHAIDLRKHRQVNDVIYKELGLDKLLDEDKDGRAVLLNNNRVIYRTPKEVLRKLAVKTSSPFPGIVMQHRSIDDVLKTYAKSLAESCVKSPMFRGYRIYSEIDSTAYVMSLAIRHDTGHLLDGWQ